MNETIERASAEYPSSLVILKRPSSKFWQARVWYHNKMRVKSMRTEDKEQARQKAILWFTSLCNKIAFENSGPRIVVPYQDGHVQMQLTKEEVAAMMAAQNNLCRICAVPFSALPKRSINVDHDHATNAVRGVLCFKCNLMLGYAKDKPEILQNAASYLISFGK